MPVRWWVSQGEQVQKMSQGAPYGFWEVTMQDKGGEYRFGPARIIAKGTNEQCCPISTDVADQLADQCAQVRRHGLTPREKGFRRPGNKLIDGQLVDAVTIVTAAVSAAAVDIVKVQETDKRGPPLRFRLVNIFS